MQGYGGGQSRSEGKTEYRRNYGHIFAEIVSFFNSCLFYLCYVTVTEVTVSVCKKSEVRKWNVWMPLKWYYMQTKLA